MRDFNLYLPADKGITSIAIVPEFKDMHPLIQRAVCIMATHDDSGLRINDVPILSFIQQTANRDTGRLSQSLSFAADRLRDLMNYDGVCVSSVEFIVSSAAGGLAVDINISPTNEDSTVSSNIYTE